MVSLGQNFNMSSGARFMRDAASANDEDRHQLYDPVFSSSDERHHFTSLKTRTAFSFHLLISFIISLTGVSLAIAWPESKRCEAYFIMLYLRATFWGITLIFDHIVKRHHENLRYNGYHEFYRSISMHKGIPFYVVSLWNTAILINEALMQHYYGHNFWKHCIQRIFSPILYITIFCVLETIVLTFVNGTYIARVTKFNKAAQPPDALAGSFVETGAVGLLQPDTNVSDLLEKQADLIHYLKDHNFRLNQKLMQLNAQVRTVNLPQT